MNNRKANNLKMKRKKKTEDERFIHRMSIVENYRPRYLHIMDWHEYDEKRADFMPSKR